MAKIIEAAEKRAPSVEEFIQTLCEKKSHKVRKIIIKDDPLHLSLSASRKYEFITKKGENFNLYFYKGTGTNDNPAARMRLEIQDENIIYVKDPAYDPATPILILKMKDINKWTTKEIMLFVIENLMMPDQEKWNQFFGPEPKIIINTDSDLNVERELKFKSYTKIDLTSDGKKDFFTA